MSQEVHATLLCLRRGPVARSHDTRALGQEDVPLAAASGRSETKVVSLLASFRPDRVISSDLRRCSETAERVANKADAPLTLRRELREQRFGRWQGRDWAEIVASEETEAVAFLSDFTRGTPPGGESLEKVRNRVRRAIFAECRRKPRGTILYVGHAGPIRTLIAGALGLELAAVQRMRLDPFGLSILHLHGSASTLTLLNHPATGESVAHLPCS